MEKQIDNRVSPKSKALIRNCLTRSMERGGSASPEPSPPRARPALSNQDGDQVKAALLSDKLKDVLSPSTLNRIRSVLADQADPATPPLPRSPSPSTQRPAPQNRSPPRHRPMDPGFAMPGHPNAEPVVGQPHRSSFPAAWNAPAAPPRGGPPLRELQAAPLAVSTLDALRSQPHLIPAATDGLGGEPGAHLLALAAASLQSSMPNESYGGVVMRAVAAIDPGMLAVLVLVARMARSLPEQKLKVYHLTLHAAAEVNAGGYHLTRASSNGISDKQFGGR